MYLNSNVRQIHPPRRPQRVLQTKPFNIGVKPTKQSIQKFLVLEIRAHGIPTVDHHHRHVFILIILFHGVDGLALVIPIIEVVVVVVVEHRRHVTLEQRHVTEELGLPREAGAARAPPLGLPAVLQMALQVRQDREALLVAAVAGVHLGAVTPLEVVLHADHRLQGPELLVRLVPVATDVRTREPSLRRPGDRRLLRRRRRLREGLRRLELVAVRAHVHPQVRVALETLPADLAEMDVLGQDLHGVELHDLAVLFSGPGASVFHSLPLHIRSSGFAVGRVVGGPRVSDQGRAAGDDLLDGGGDLGGHHGHLVFVERSVEIDRLR